MKRNLLAIVLALSFVAGGYTPPLRPLLSNLPRQAGQPAASEARLASLPWDSPAGPSPLTNAAPSTTATLPEPLTTVTDEEGYYRFENLSEASHMVWLDLATLPADLARSNSESGPRLLLSPGQSAVSEAIAGLVRFSATYDRLAGTLDGRVFLDANLNGIYDPSETGLAGVTVIDPGVFIYFVPGDNQDLLDAYQAINDCSFGSNNPNQGLDSLISITASHNNTQWFYDHHEDGFDADPTAPGATTLSGSLPAGQSQIFETRQDLTATPTHTPASTYPYDGGDRIVIVGNPVAVVRTAWPSDAAVSTRLAGAWEAYAIDRWGTAFVIPAGEDITSPPFDEDFESSHIFVMAQADGTNVTYDLNDGAGPQMTALNAGESVRLSGVRTGATVSSSEPVQVHMMAGECGHLYAARGYHILPNSRLENQYYVPTPSFSDAACNIPQSQSALNGDRFTKLYIHNPGTSDLTVAWQTNSANGTVVVPVQGTQVLTNPVGAAPYDSGMHLSASDVFNVIASVDAGGADYDWGYSPIPRRELTAEVVLGWAPGTADLDGDGSPDPPFGGRNQNGNLAFVTAVVTTTVFVDLNNDLAPDNFDMNGDGDAGDLNVFGNPNWDEPSSGGGVPLNALEVLRVADPNDFDLKGAIIYTQNYQEPIAVAWGEDPCGAHFASPHFDGGFTIPPLPVVTLTKDDGLVNDPAMCAVNPGQVVTYTLVAENVGRATLNNLTLMDSLPFTDTDFLLGSVSTSPPASQVTYNGGTYVPPPGPPGAPDPMVESVEVVWSSVAAGQAVTLTFAVKIDQPVTSGAASFENMALVTSPDLAQEVTSTDPEDPADPDTTTCINRNLPDLTLAKDNGQTIFTPGQNLTYTIVYTNIGAATAANALITDTLPTGFTFSDATQPHTFIPGPPDQVVFSLGDVLSQTSGVVTVTGQIDPGFTGSVITNNACIGTDTPELDLTNNCDDDTDTTLPADLTVSKDDGQTVVSTGQTLTYVVTYANIGQGTAVNSIMTDTLPVGFIYLDSTNIPGVITRTTVGAPPTQVIFGLGDLAAAATGSVTITGQVDPNFTGSLITNTVRIGTDTPETDTTNNSDDDIDQLPPPSPTLTKFSDPSVVNVGDRVTFVIRSTNEGNRKATGASIVDDVPVYLDILSVTTSPQRPVSIVGQKATVDIGDMAPGFEIVVTMITRVNEKARPLIPLTIENTAFLFYNEDPPLEDDTDVRIPPPGDDDDGTPPPPPPAPAPTPGTPPPPPGPAPTPGVLQLPETGASQVDPGPSPALPLGLGLLFLASGLLMVARQIRRNRRRT